MPPAPPTGYETRPGTDGAPSDDTPSVGAPSDGPTGAVRHGRATGAGAARGTSVADEQRCHGPAGPSATTTIPASAAVDPLTARARPSGVATPVMARHGWSTSSRSHGRPSGPAAGGRSTTRWSRPSRCIRAASAPPSSGTTVR